MSKIIKILLGIFIILVLVLGYLILNTDFLTNLQNTKTEETLPPLAEKDPPKEVYYTYEERMERGYYYANNAFLSLAINEFTKASQIHPEFAEPYFELGKNHIFLKNFEKAQLNIEKALEIQPQNEEFLIYLAKNHIKQSEFEKAKALFLENNSVNPEINYYLALFDLLANDNESAKNKFKQVSDSTDDAKLKEKTANLLNSYDEFSLFKGGKAIHLRTLLAKSLNQVEEYEISLAILKEILKEKNDYRDAWILAGYAYLSLESYEFALDSFRKAYDLDSEKPETQYFLGLTYLEIGQTEDALTYLNIALKNGFEPQIQIKQKLGDLYLAKKDYNKAVQMLEEVLQLNDQNVNTFIRPIWIYLDFLNDPDKALELSQKAYKAHPNNAMAFNLLAWSHLGKNEYLKAEEYLQKATSLDPNLQAAWYNLGRVYEGLAQKEKALEHYQKAYEMGKDSPIGNIAAKAYNELYSE